MPKPQDEKIEQRLNRLYELTRHDDATSVSRAHPLTMEAWHVIRQAKDELYSERFDFMLQTLPDQLLDGLLDSTHPRRLQDALPADSALLMLLLAIRRDIHGDQGNGFFTSAKVLKGIVSSDSVLNPYFVLELIRRLNPSTSFKLPVDPYSYCATVNMQGLQPADIQAANMELERRRLEFPLPTMLVDPRSLQSVRTGMSIVMPMTGNSAMVFLEFAIPPEDAPPLDPEAFTAALRSAVERAHSLESVSQTPLFKFMPQEHSLDENSSMRLLDLHRMSDVAGLHIAAALQEYFGADPAQHQSAAMRLHALMALLDQEQLDRWFVHLPEGWGLHPAVLHTAATMQLSISGEFWHDFFEEEVFDRVEHWHNR